jgi:hypothetical protein
VTGQRPQFILWATILIAVNAIGGVLFSTLWPDLDDRGTVVSVSIVIAAIMLVTAWFLWNGNRWGTIAAIVVQALNMLLALPGFSESDMIAGVLITLLLSVATIVLVLLPESRAFWNGGRRVATA